MPSCYCRLLFLLPWCFMLATLATSSAQEAGAKILAEEDKQLISSLIEVISNCHHIPGLSLSVVNKTSVLLEAGYGHADKAKGTRVTPDTLFAIGSTTKAFTVTLLAKLIEKHQHSWNWDTPVKKLLDDNFRLMTKELTEQTTLRDLLSHRTGIPGYFVPLLAGYPRDTSRADLVRLLQYFEPQYPFRTQFHYNNYMYALAGHVAEVLEGESWEVLNRDHILLPLNMTSSRYAKDITDDTPMALPYTYDMGQFKICGLESMHQADVAGPAGSILSSARDMSKWLQFHLQEGRTPHGNQLVEQTLLASTYHGEMASPDPIKERDMHRPKYPVSDVLVSYDLAWMTSFYRGYKRIWHSGGIATFKTLVWFYPDIDIGMFISISGPPTSDATWVLILTLQYISDLVMGETPWLNVTTVCDFPEPWEEAKPPYRLQWPHDRPGKPLMDYVGTFSHPGFCDVSVYRNTSTNTLHLKMGLYLVAELLYNRSCDTFYTKLKGELWYMSDTEKIPVQFKHSLPGGEIDMLELPLYSPYNTAKRVTFSRGAARKSMGGEKSPICSKAYCLMYNATPMLSLAILVIMLMIYKE